jgi:hypothetical protein
MKKKLKKTEVHKNYEVENNEIEEDEERISNSENKTMIEYNDYYFPLSLFKGKGFRQPEEKKAEEQKKRLGKRLRYRNERRTN